MNVEVGPAHIAQPELLFLMEPRSPPQPQHQPPRAKGGGELGQKEPHDSAGLEKTPLSSGPWWVSGGDDTGVKGQPEDEG